MSEPEILNHFEKRVIAALSDYSVSYMKAVENAAPLPRLSVSALMRHYRISRSLLYEKHPSLLAKIAEVFGTLLYEVKQQELANKKKSISGLQAELALVRRNAKRQVAVAHSIQFKEFLNRYGPVLRNAEEQWREHDMKDQTIEELREENARQRRMIRDLTRRNNS